MADPIFVQGVRGLNDGADSLPAIHRMGRGGDLIVSQVRGPYHEACSRGKLFIASIGVGGVAPGTALSTSPALTLWNPASSGIMVSIRKIMVGYVSGTLGAGSLVHSQNTSQATAPTGGTAITPIAANLGAQTAVSKVYTGSTISATSTLIRPSIILGASLATTAALPVLMEDEVQSEIIVPAGVAWCYQGIAAAGTSPLIMISVTFEEMPA